MFSRDYYFDYRKLNLENIVLCIVIRLFKITIIFVDFHYIKNIKKVVNDTINNL